MAKRQKQDNGLIGCLLLIGVGLLLLPEIRAWLIRAIVMVFGGWSMIVVARALFNRKTGAGVDANTTLYSPPAPQPTMGEHGLHEFQLPSQPTGARTAASVNATPLPQAPVTSCGFRQSPEGIRFCFQAAGQRIVTSPVSQITSEPTGHVIILTRSGSRYRTLLPAEHRAQYEELCSPPPAAAAAVPTPRETITTLGFLRTGQAVHLRFEDAWQGQKVSSPILAVESLTDDWHLVRTCTGSEYRTRLSPAQRQEYLRCLQLANPPLSSPADTASPTSVTRPRVTTPSFSQLTWIGLEQRVTIHNRELQDPLIYVSDGPTPENEASCIDRQLSVSPYVAKSTTRELPYWPRYRDLTPSQRATYLSWLANGRKDPVSEIGYVFIFFYGLERRLLLDRQDFRPALSEIARLLELYPFSNSFNGYARKLIAYALARFGLSQVEEQFFNALVKRTKFYESEHGFAVSLGWLAANQKPITAEWAMRIAARDARAQQSVVVERVREQFEMLFRHQYQQRFGDGMLLRTSKHRCAVTYHSASPSLHHTYGYGSESPPVEIPNVLGIQSQFETLAMLWNECIEELRGLSRQVGKGIDIQSRAAYEALPVALKEVTQHPDLPKWEKLVTGHARVGGISLVPVAALAEIQGFPPRERLTPSQSQELAQTAQEVGLAIEPDARSTRRSYQTDDLVALYPAGRYEEHADGLYAAAALLLELGLALAAIDGQIEAEEVSHIAQFLEAQFELSPLQVRRLEACKTLFLERPPTFNNLGRRLQSHLDLEQRELLAQFLAGVAAANGKLSRDEQSALKKATKALGLEANYLYDLACRLLPTTDEPVVVRRATPAEAVGEAIPPRPQAPDTPRVALNEDLLRKIMQDTRHVAQMLTEVMDEGADEPDEGAEPAAEVLLEREPTPTTELPPLTKPTTDPRFPDLDLRYHAVLSELLLRTEWAAKEFEALVRQHGLYPSSTVEIVNEWAEEYLGDLLIEEGDSLLIQCELISLTEL